MKKSYLLLFTLAGAMFTYGQKPNLNFPGFPAEVNSNGENYTDKENSNVEKTLGVVVWSDDFSTPSNWVADNAGQASPFGWNIGTSTNTWWASFSGGINSTSGGNFAELYNGDYNAGDQAINVEYTLTTSSAIDINALAGTDAVSISFEQYGAKFNDLQEVQISFNNVIWETVGDNNDLTTFVGNNNSAVYANPMKRTFNIGPNIAAAGAGASSSVWIRFKWTSNFASNPDPVAWTTFGWFIDDVEIVTNPTNDLAINYYFFGTAGLKYYKIPSTQIAPIEFYALVSNNGSKDQPETTLNADATGVSTYSGTSAAGNTLQVFGSDSLYTTTAFTPSTTLGSIDVNISLSSDSTDLYGDDDPSNNSVSESFEITEYIYARDEGGTPGSGGGEDGNNPGSFGFEAGNFFDCFADQMVYNIDVVIGANTPDGTPIYGKIYVYDTVISDWLYVEQTDEYNVTSADASSNNTITLPFFSPVSLTNGSYYLVVVGCYSEFYYGTSGTTDPQTSFIFYPYFDPNSTTGQYYTTRIPMVRLNFQDFTGLEEHESGITLGQNMPNPFNSNSTINFNLNTSDNIQIEITDLRGRLISRTDLGELNPGEHTFELNSTGMNSGVYYYSLVVGEDRITKKMVIQK